MDKPLEKIRMLWTSPETTQADMRKILASMVTFLMHKVETTTGEVYRGKLIEVGEA